MIIIVSTGRTLLMAAICALVAASGAVQAQGYVGVGLGLARQSLSCAAGAPCTPHASGGKALIGYRFDAAWSAELVALGAMARFTASDDNAATTWQGRVSTRALGTTAGYELDVAAWRLQVRFGLAQVRGAFTSQTGGVSDSRARATQPLLGLGLRHPLGAGTGLRLDWDTTRSKAYQRAGRFNLVGLAIQHNF